MPKGNSTFNREMEEATDGSKGNVDVSMLDQESPPNFVTFRDRLAVEELRKDFKISQDAILAAMENMFSKQETKLNAMSKDFEDVKDTVKFLSDNYDDMIKKHVVETNNRVTALEAHSSQCLSREKLIMDLEWKLDNLEQQARLSNIEITELPEKRGENLLETVLQIAEVIKCPITKADIIDVHRVPHGNSEDRRPKNIIVKLSSKSLKENILSKSRLCKGVTLAQLGIRAKPEEKIFLNEHLTIKNKILLREARILAKQHGYRFVWPKNGIIFVRAEVTTPVFAVRTRAELEKIKPLQPC